MNLLGEYKNGNYTVKIYSDGTKIRKTEENEFKPLFSESCDIHISNCCNNDCEFCYAGCTPTGKYGDIINQKFLKTLHPYTEIAVNLNFPVHPDFKLFLTQLRKKNIITNITVNQIHFMENQEYIQNLYKDNLIYGLGISLVNPSIEFIDMIKQYPNAVIHTINGILKSSDIEILSDNKLKILILGYKKINRGKYWYEKNYKSIEKNQDWLKENLLDILYHFEAVSFDNLAIEQLKLNYLMSQDKWEKFYMGDDGEFTFYIDLVNKTFSKSSLSTEHFPITDSIDDMFKKIKNM